MRKMLITGAATVLAVSPTTAQAGFTASSTVIGVDVGDSGHLYIRFEDATQCGSSLVYVPRSAVYYADALAIALSSFSTGKKLSVWIQACDGAGPQQAYRFVNGTVW